MALLNKDEIVIAWNALASCHEDNGWRTIPISTIGSIRILAARHFPSNLEAMLVGFPSISFPHKSKLPHGNGFELDIVDLHDGGKNWLALIRQNQGSLDLFSMMSADIAATLANSHFHEESKLFHVFLGRIRAWQEFMKNGGEGLTLEAELGLVGELTCLEMLLDAGIPIYVAVESWKGPEKGIHDFELGTGAIEVKSTLATIGFPATIQSLEQLDNSIRNPLFLCACRYRIGNTGTTLPERIELLRQRIAIDDVSKQIFNSALFLVGYIDSHAEKYSRKYISIENGFWLVDDSFPRLVSGNVPIGIRSARYEIDIEMVKIKTYSVDQAIELIEGI